MCINRWITNINPPSFGGPPKFRWTVTLDNVYVSVMQLRGMWDSPLLNAFSQYPSFPLLRAISIVVRPLWRHPPYVAFLLPSPPHTETSCPDPSALQGSTVPRRSTVPPSVSAQLL